MGCNLEDMSPHVNFEHDILYWQWDTVRPFSECRRYKFDPRMMGKLRHLAIDEDFLMDHSANLLGDSAFDMHGEARQHPEVKSPNERIFEFGGLKTLTVVDFEDVSASDDGEGLINDMWTNLHEKREEQEKRRDLEDREMVFMGWKDKEVFITWFAGLMDQRPDWKAPNLRFMSIESTLKASCRRLLEEVSLSQNQGV
jgi:hypothetical protein